MYIQNKIPVYISKKLEPINGTQFMSYFYNTKDILNSNPESTIKRCFNILYHDGLFLKAIYSNLVEYDGCGEEGCYWYYPDMNSPYPEDRFDGVYFAVGFNDPSSTVYVSEQVCFEYAKHACERFMEIHPELEYRKFLTDIINNWKPLNG